MFMDYIQGATIVVFNSLLTVFGTVGNFLIIFTVLCTPAIRERVSNKLLLSLAIADLLVTMVAQPLFAVSMSLKTFTGRCSLPLEKAYLTGAPFSAVASALHLAAISLDRVISAIKPHQHRQIITKWYKFILAVCWGSPTLLSSLLVLFPPIQYAIQTCLILSFAVMLSSYGAILCKIKGSPNIAPTNPTKYRSACERAMEKRVSGTIAIVIVLFAVCWFPLVGYVFSRPAKASLLCSFDVKLSWIRFLLLSNSSMNFVVYSWRIRRFRAAYIRIVKTTLKRLRKAIQEWFCHISEETTNSAQPYDTP